MMSSSRNLSARSPVAPGSSSLDLSTAPSAPPASAPVPVRPVSTVRRARSRAQTILTPKAPAVTLTRVQSGVGTLTFEAACSPAVGDLRLGCAYQLRAGYSNTVHGSGPRRLAPAGSNRPVIVGHRDEHEKLTVDLRQARTLERLIVFGYSESGVPLHWGGTLVVTTFGQARIVLPLDRPPMPGAMVLLSLYNVAGEYVLRAEMDALNGTLRHACLAFGYDRITWLDERTPVD